MDDTLVTTQSLEIENGKALVKRLADLEETSSYALGHAAAALLYPVGTRGEKPYVKLPDFGHETHFEKVARMVEDVGIRVVKVREENTRYGGMETVAYAVRGAADDLLEQLRMADGDGDVTPHVVMTY